MRLSTGRIVDIQWQDSHFHPDKFLVEITLCAVMTRKELKALHKSYKAQDMLSLVQTIELVPLLSARKDCA